MEYIVEIVAILLASALVMILHELPKSIMYLLTSRHCREEDRKNIFKIHRYIDPIGLVFFLVCHAGASRPYPYRLKEKDTNVAIAMVGFFALILMIFGGCAFYNFLLMRFPVLYSADIQDPAMLLMIKMSWYFIYASIVLLIVNLFPTPTSDMFLLIVAIAPSKLLSLLKYDSLVKVALLLCFVFQYVQNWALMGMDMMYEFLGFI